jgi:2-oxoisovalerate dehydrogenase E2 component (dihydrolipoyl transacylase)
MGERVFAMPDLGEGLEEGEIVAWLVGEGDDVSLNQPLVEVETAKATVEIPSPFAGVVRTLHGSVGQAIAVGSPLATFDVEGATEAPPSLDVPMTEPAETAPTARPSSEPARATPPVRKLARTLGVDLASVAATGPGGRITTEDVQRTADGRTDGTNDTTESATVADDEAGIERRPLSTTRRTIAQNLSAQAAIPQVTTFRTVDCEALDSFRRERKVSPLPVVIAGLCRIIGDHPLLNASWADTEILVHTSVHVGLAVDTDRGLVVPVLQDARERGVSELATEIDRLATGAREGSLALEDLAADPTIAVSNTGSYGSEAGTPLLSPNTAVTLAIGVIQPRVLVVDGQVAPRLACTLSCTFDHRVLDGATVGRALTDLVGLLEDPDSLGDLSA